MKKLSLFVFFLTLIALLVSCTGKITIEGDQDISLKEGDKLTLDLTTTDKKGLIFTSSNENIVTISEDGEITAVSMGDAVITVTSKTNSEITFSISIEVLKKVNLSAETLQIVLVEGNDHEVIYTSNDDVTFESSATSIFTVDSEGVISGLTEGSGMLTITSVNDPTVKVDIQVTVRKIVTLEVTEYTQELVIGDEGSIVIDSEEGYTYLSGDEMILTVDEAGKVIPVSSGETTVTIRSTYDETVFEVITIKVYKPTESLTISGSSTINYYQTETLTVQTLPTDSYPYVAWESSNQDVLTIDESGELAIHGVGSATITATSTFNDTVKNTLVIEVVNQLLVDDSATSGTLDYEEMTYTYGVDLFTTIQQAITAAEDGAHLFIQTGTYSENITLNKPNLTLEGIQDVLITGQMVVDADNLSIKNLEMQGASSITSTKTIGNLTIQGIEAKDITGDFIALAGTKLGLMISDNIINNVSGFAIKVTGYESGIITIMKNLISNAQTAISVTPATTHLETTEIKVERNDISQVTDGIIIETHSAIHAYARFNSVVGATGFLAKSNEGNEVEFTLNHWGMDTLDLLKFSHIDEAMLLGYYSLKTEIISENDYNPTIPAKIIIENPISEMRIDDSYQFTYTSLPYDLETLFIRWITSAPELMTISRDGVVTPLKSGNVTLTVRSTINYAINSTVSLTIITDPGIELKPINVNNQNIVGETLMLEATPFPANIKDTDVSFTSSNDTIASVNIDGLVSLHQPGVVTITAALADNPTVTNTFTFEVYSSLDENNLLDLLTKSMVTYTTPHKWTAVGVTFNYQDFKYESVSKYYFGDYTINDSKLLPISEGIRPGYSMTEHPEGITQYNPYNVYWVVVHDTANTNPGAGALSHANYLYSNAMAGTVLNVSWHFTIDDKDLYQHLPETERGYHAGDGSTLPGTSTLYAGGGNRNGIGIETGVNQDADVYRTWQRTAKFGTDLIIKYNLPLTHMRYHVDFSGKNCPQTMRNAGLVPLFEEMKMYEYKVNKNFPEAEITFVSDNPEYVDHTGRVIKMPDRAMTVSYTVSVMIEGVTTSRTFYSYLPGTVV
jgi:N-acetylmuramoyl-L-alanine amidase